MRGLTIAAPFALVLALLAACGESAGSGPEMTLPEYFQQLQEADSLASSRFAQIRDQLDQAPQDDPEAGLQALKDIFPEQIVTLQDLVDSMEGLKPPPEIEDAHNEAVDALKVSIEMAEQSSDAIQDLTSPQGASAILSNQETAAADQATSQTCLALERAGTDRGITVDLDC